MRAERLVLELRPRARRRLGTRASTTRAPSRSRSATHASAASQRSVSRPSPIPGGCRSRPTVSPARRGSGTGRCVRTDHMSATSSTLRAIGPTVSSVGQRGNTPSRERDPTASSTRRSRTPRRAGGPSTPCPSRVRARRGRPRGRQPSPTTSRRSSSPDGSGSGRCRTTRSGRARSRRTREGASCRRGPLRRRAGAGPRAPSGRARARA